MKLRVKSITWEAEDIRSFELVDPEGGELPPFDPGSHLDVRAPNGAQRRYSICNSPRERDRYVIGVLDQPNGRGGSRAMHQHIRAGDLIEVTGPHNFFPVTPGAKHTILLAGGIGITPIMAMRAALEGEGSSYELHYCARSADRAAFMRSLSADVAKGSARLHFDEGDPSRGLDIRQLLREQPEGTHVYFCGPNGFMTAVREATAHWTPGTVHFEYFGTEPIQPVEKAGSAQGHQIILQKSGVTIDTTAAQTVLEAVRGAGVEAESSCEAGMCGACKTRYVSGKPGHNDFVLSDDEREEYVLICCATIEEGPLVLDL